MNMNNALSISYEMMKICTENSSQSAPKAPNFVIDALYFWICKIYVFFSVLLLFLKLFSAVHGFDSYVCARLSQVYFHYLNNSIICNQFVIYFTVYTENVGQ